MKAKTPQNPRGLVYLRAALQTGKWIVEAVNGDQANKSGTGTFLTKTDAQNTIDNMIKENPALFKNYNENHQ